MGTKSWISSICREILKLTGNQSFVHKNEFENYHSQNPAELWGDTTAWATSASRSTVDWQLQLHTWSSTNLMKFPNYNFVWIMSIFARYQVIIFNLHTPGLDRMVCTEGHGDFPVQYITECLKLSSGKCVSNINSQRMWRNPHFPTNQIIFMTFPGLNYASRELTLQY